MNRLAGLKKAWAPSDLYIVGSNCGVSILFWARQPVVGCGLADILKGRPDYELVACCESLERAVVCARKSAPALILAHVTHPVGLAEIRALHDAAASARLVLWGEDFCAEFVAEAVHFGVCGVLARTISIEELFAALADVRQGVLRFDRELMGSMIAGAKMALTERQRQLVSLLTQGLKNKEIAGAMGVTEASVKVYVNLLLHKLGLRTRLELALYGRKRGFVAEDGRGLLDPEILTPKVELAGVADLLEAPAVGTAVFGSEQVQRRVLEQRSRPCAREARGPAPCERRHPAMPRAPLAARRNCTCGLCPKCRDNARWERIYQAKFEDPNYYRKGPAAFIRSGLSDIGG